jgi:hypothetical protein
LEALLTHHPNQIQARQSLMIAYRSVGDDQRADEQKQIVDRLRAPQTRLTELRSLAARNPWNSGARLEAAQLNSNVNYSEALAWIRSALASGPDDPHIRMAWVQLAGYQPPPLLRDFHRRRQRSSEID